MRQITPAAMLPRKAWAGDGGFPGSIVVAPIAFKLSKATCFGSFALFNPLDLNLCAPINNKTFYEEVQK
jgi:hypothetical protein